MKQFTDIQEAVRQIVALASGLSVDRLILSGQGRSIKDDDVLYGTYKPYPVRAYGHPRKDRALAVVDDDSPEQGWEDFEETTVSQLELLVSVNFINDGARDCVWRVQNANFRQPVIELLRENNIGWRYASEARRLTGLHQAGFQSRWQVDIHMVVEAEITDSVLRAAGFDLEIQDEFGNVIGGN